MAFLAFVYWPWPPESVKSPLPKRRETGLALPRAGGQQDRRRLVQVHAVQIAAVLEDDGPPRPNDGLMMPANENDRTWEIEGLPLPTPKSNEGI